MFSLKEDHESASIVDDGVTYCWYCELEEWVPDYAYWLSRYEVTWDPTIVF